MESLKNLLSQNLSVPWPFLCVTFTVERMWERTNKKRKQTCWRMNYLYKKILCLTVKAFRPKNNVQFSCPRRTLGLVHESEKRRPDGLNGILFLILREDNQHRETLLISCIRHVCSMMIGAIKRFASWLWPLILWFLSSLRCGRAVDPSTVKAPEPTLGPHLSLPAAVTSCLSAAGEEEHLLCGLVDLHQSDASQNWDLQMSQIR